MKDILKALVFGGLFLIPFLPVYVETSMFFPFITGKNFAFRIIVEIVFAAWILLALYEPKYRPKFSWILAGFSIFLAVMAVANAFGEYPQKSFWSNFERMEGYVTLVHLFLYIVVAGTVMTAEKLWSYFMHLSVAIALFVAVYGLAQYGGLIEGGRDRVDSRLGNAAYMAVYLLFHIFFVCWLFVRSKVTLHKIIYILIGLIFAYTLLQTGTRGTFLGFIGGIGVMIGYVAIFGRKYPEMRKVAIGGCIAVIIAILGFLAVKDSNFVQSQSSLARIANISLEKDLTIRGIIWSMAFEGVKERPILGWGQGNFNYVFNKNYDPRLYSAESWFDRTHDIFLDWLIAGGILGFLSYFSILAAALYYLFWLPLFKNDQRFDVLERAVLLGLVAGYLIHNVVVFDNIISYIFYGTLLALIHVRISEPIEKVNNLNVSQKLVIQVYAPVVILLLGATIYFVNVPGIAAARGIIDAMQQQTITGRLEELHKALAWNSFGDQEIVEQLAQQAISISGNAQMPEEEKKLMRDRAERDLVRLNTIKPGDARLRNFLSSFYRAYNFLPQAREQAALARDLSPKKQSIIIEQGIIEIQMRENEKAREFFKEAYELDTRNTQALVLYAASLANLGRMDEVKELVGTENITAFALNDFALSAVNQAGDKEYLATLFEARVAAQPENPQHRASLSYIYYELGQVDKSIAVLEKAAEEITTFSETAECLIDNMKEGNKPNDGC